ncbi:MAG TPA: restriction endonuclease [Chryseobacterium sp.]|nr:restriction endonuclease [Chryseobacterium sp.]
MYQELQTQVFNWLKEKHNRDNNFTFSVRQKANKGAELNYFIGTEKSKYFSTTFWYVPVAYPGSSSDLMNLVFTVTKHKKIEFHFQFNQTKSPHDNQNKYALELIESIKPLFKGIFPNEYFAPDTNKMELFAGYSNPIYNNFDELKNDLETFLDKVIPIVDQQIALFKSKYQDFTADRYTVEEQKNMFTKMEERFKKYKIIEDLTEELEEEEELIMVDSEIDYNFPLNQILYGPPGTGKTYNTVNKAISIANPEFNLNQKREFIKAEYDRLVEAGQIMFTTFHPSMSYEDFIEGIKPQIEEDTDENKTVIYEIKHGVFKYIAEVASNTYFYVGQNIEGYKIVNIGTELIQLKKPNAGSIVPIPKYLIDELYNLVLNNIITVNDIKNKNVIGKMSNMTEKYIINGYPNIFSRLVQVQVDNNKHHQNYVLIIDEINRGNVSQIFGELITLIEESKRIGNEEELKVTLPYSKKEFGVPSNLYIIGTMNTADRSVEALDTALRRRFSFVEMMPDLKVVEERQFSDFPRVEVMQKINQRIELLLDKNYTLGHSYFLKDNFRSSFKNEIIPLLQEYFYNDCGKIGLILGKGFVREKEISKANQHNVFADFDTRNEIEIIKSYELIPFEDIEFNSAIESLLV